MDQERLEQLRKPTLGVFEETATLREVLMWGPPGTEAVLGQLLPARISCFQTQFDVPAARREFEKARATLEREGVKVILVKDLCAQMIDGKKLAPEGSLVELKQKMTARALRYYKKYRVEGISCPDEVLPWLDAALTADVEKYGEGTAILMNEILSLKNDLPLANILYARDQSNLLGTTFIWSSMRHRIRQPEVHLYKTILNHSGVIRSNRLEQVQIKGKGKFEGGDGIASNGVFYIGVGGRSNLDGIMQAAPSILRKHGRILIPYDQDRDQGLIPEMDAMHLDTIWMPCGPKTVVACTDEVARRKLLEVTVGLSGKPKITDIGWFADHLEQKGVELVPLTKDEQAKYAPNFLNLGHGKIVLSLADGNNLTTELTRRGKTVFNADLKNITKGYGGLHCMTASIKRG